MGGRGASSSMGGSSVTSVMTQGGVEADLSGMPLIYGKPDSALTPAQRATIEAQEKKRSSAKIEYSYMVDANGKPVVGINGKAEIRGGRNGVGTPNYMLAQSDVFTHNHPRSKGEEGIIGGSFSPKDIETYGKFSNLQTMRASANEGTYSITKGKNFDAQGFQKHINTKHSESVKKAKSEYDSLSQRYLNGEVSASEYKKEFRRINNAHLVRMHNTYRSGANQFGYSYTLERRT